MELVPVPRLVLVKGTNLIPNPAAEMTHRSRQTMSRQLRSFRLHPESAQNW